MRKDALARFIAAVVERYEASTISVRNRAASRCAAVALVALAGAQESIDNFATLLGHDDDRVRLKTAMFLLRRNKRSESARATLLSIAESNGPHAWQATLALKAEFTRLTGMV